MNKTQIIIIILAFTFVSCTKNNKSEIVANFLNNTEKSFDKKKFELVSLDLLDTIYENDIYKYQDFKSYPAIISDDFEVIDTMAVGDEPYVQNEIYWDYEPFSLALYNQLQSFTYVNFRNCKKKEMFDVETYMLQNGSNKFLNNISNESPDFFKNKLLYNEDFLNKLKTEIKFYDNFKGVLSSDSIFKLVKIEKIKLFMDFYTNLHLEQIRFWIKNCWFLVKCKIK